MEERQITVKNLSINYKIIGQGKPLLVLHGWPSSSDKWVKVAEILSGHNIMVIVPDLPGFGKSEAPRIAWSLDNYVEWLLEFSENAEELKQGFLLLGHSFGGALAAKFSIKYNQKVEKLFLMAAACVRKRTFIKKSLYRLAKIIKIFSFVPYYEVFRKAFYRLIIRKSDYTAVSGVMKETYLRVISDDLSYKLFFIKTPTVLVWGDKDESTPIDQAHFINHKIRNSTLIIVPGQGHSLQLAVPEILAEKILSHI